MSLVVELYPVPWKILDLVKARILKNRAKKAKKGLDWSKETLRREMALSPAPLISRRRDEPSFFGSDMFFAIWFGGYVRLSLDGGYTQISTRFTVKLNNQILGEVNLLPLSNQYQQFIFIWSALETDLEEVPKFTFPDTVGLVTVSTVVNDNQPSPTEVSVLELSNITSTDEQYSAALNYNARFFNDDEFTRFQNGGALLPKNQNPGTLTYTLQNWRQ
jgi:hypothetical protein